MKVKTCLLSLLLMSILVSCSGVEDLSNSNVNNGNSTTVSTFGGSNNDSTQSVVATTDGGYAVLGFTQSNDGNITDKLDETFDYWVIKFDAQQTVEWQKTYGGSDDDRGRKIIQTNDGGYAIIGTSASDDFDVTENNGSQDFWIVKLDTTGNISWEKSFGFQGDDMGISVIQTSDLGYLLTGVLDVTSSNGQGNTSRNSSSRHAGGDYWAIKLDASGNMQWTKFFGGNFTDTAEGVIETNNGDFIIAGGSDSIDTDISGNKGTYDFWVIRIDVNGILVWEKSFGGSQTEEARAIVKSPDGNIVIAGETRSNDLDISGNNGAADFWLIKISPDGNLIWQKSLGGSSFDVARDINPTQDNGFLLTGSTRSSDGDVSENKGQNDIWVVKIDGNANIQWEKTIGGSNIDFGFGVTELNDKTVIAVGDTTSNDGDIEENKGFTDALIVTIN